LAALNAITVAVTIDETPLSVPNDYRPHQFPCAWFTPDGHLQRCEFWAHCWNGTAGQSAADEGGTVDAPDTWGDLVADYVQTLDEIKTLKDTLKPLEAHKKEWEQFFAQWLDQHGAERLNTPQGLLQRTVSKPSTTWDIDQAIADGLVSPELLAPYRRDSAPRVTWRWKSHPVKP
jgi:hypothetical protein